MKQTAGRVLLELATIILGIVLGFVANDWNDTRQQRQAARTAAHSILQEIAHNRRYLHAHEPYNQMLLDSSQIVLAALAEGKRIPGLQFRGLALPTLQSAAFENARAQSLFNAMPPAVTEEVLRAYAFQAFEQDFLRNANHALLQRDLENYRTWNRFLYYYAVSNTFNIPQLFRHYDAAEQALRGFVQAQP